MGFDSTLAQIRFGTGLSPQHRGPAHVTDMLETLAGPDRMARKYPISTFTDHLPAMHKIRERNLASRQPRNASNKEKIAAQAEKAKAEMYAKQQKAFPLNLARAVAGPDGFRERLVGFWADHFTVVGKNGLVRNAVPAYVEEAIRPNVNRTFGDLLKAAVAHPMMLMYLDQFISVGPNSFIGKKRNLGLNENLAREVLELHTLGVDGKYSQEDVRQLAELMTGLTTALGEGSTFKPDRAEPGTEEVLGKVYGGGQPMLSHVFAVLDDLAVHPDTAGHIARKLAVHFVSDTPDPALVAHIRSAYLDSGGALPAVYAALLEHPSSWGRDLVKARQPYDYFIAVLRALDIKPKQITRLDAKQVNRFFARPMRRMGQNWTFADGPDGWPEEATHWITPQSMAIRINWAMRVPSEFLTELPDPRDFVQTAFGGRASEALVFAAGAAQSRAEGIGIALAAPEFQRR